MEDDFASEIYNLELLAGYRKMRRREWLPAGFSEIGLDRPGPKDNSTAEQERLASGSERCCGRVMVRHGRKRWRCKVCRRLKADKLDAETLRQRLSRKKDEKGRFC
jgi:hypothetical protein